MIENVQIVTKGEASSGIAAVLSIPRCHILMVNTTSFLSPKTGSVQARLRTVDGKQYVPVVIPIGQPIKVTEPIDGLALWDGTTGTTYYVTVGTALTDFIPPTVVPVVDRGYESVQVIGAANTVLAGDDLASDLGLTYVSTYRVLAICISSLGAAGVLSYGYTDPNGVFCGVVDEIPAVDPNNKSGAMIVYSRDSVTRPILQGLTWTPSVDSSATILAYR